MAHSLRPALRYWMRAVRVAAPAGAPGLDADAEALFALMTVTPDATRQALISDTIVALKGAGIWALLDECWFLAAHAQQAALLGWKRNKNATSINAPTFTVDRGFAGDGMTSYLSTNFVPSTDGVQYALDSASLGVYMRTHSGTATRGLIGARNGTGAAAEGQGFVLTTAATQARVNVDSSNGAASIAGVVVGLNVGRRVDSGEQELWRNGSLIATGSRVSQAVPQHALYIGALDNGGSAGEYSSRQTAFAFVADGLSPTQQAALYDIVQSYLQSIGGAV